MQSLPPRFLEWYLFCQEKEQQVFYRLYVELTELDQRLWRGKASPGELEIMRRRTGILEIVPEGATLTSGDLGTGNLIHHDIDTLLEGATERLARDDRRAWYIREG